MGRQNEEGIDMTHRDKGRSGGQSLQWVRTVLLQGWMGFLVLALGLFAGSGLAEAGGAATEAVKGTINEVIRLLEDKDLKKPERRDERRKLLERVIGERFSYEEMAKRSLAAQWPKLDDGQRQEFVGLFQSLLSRTYSDKIENYSGEPVQYINERNQEGYAEVRTKVISGKAEIPLDYRLMSKAGEWRVYDVVVDGISLVNNYRGNSRKSSVRPGGTPSWSKPCERNPRRYPCPSEWVRPQLGGKEWDGGRLLVVRCPPARATVRPVTLVKTGFGFSKYLTLRGRS